MCRLPPRGAAGGLLGGGPARCLEAPAACLIALSPAREPKNALLSLPGAREAGESGPQGGFKWLQEA